MKIFGFHHLWAVNEFEKIATEQLNVLIDSGLYEASENIFVGVLGDNFGLKKVIEIFAPYPKFVIKEYSTKADNYEFHTLRFLKEQADKESFYGFYFHNKAVSYAQPKAGTPNKPNANGITPSQAYIGGTHWRNFMNHYTLKLWNENIKELDKGYDVVGTQIRPKRDFPLHISGNFYWFKSDYVKLLKPIDALNKRDRMQAEFWIGGANPIIGTLSQKFVDYNTKTDPLADENNEPIKVVPLKKYNSEGRTIVHTLSWNVVSETECAVRQLYEMNDKKDFHHIICDLDFPLLKADEIPSDLKKSVKQNSEALKELALKYGSEYLKIKNVGVSQNWQSVAAHVRLTNDDVLTCCDSDERVDSKSGGWVKAITDVIKADDKYGYVGLIMQEQFAEFNETNSFKRKVDNYNMIDVNGLSMIACLGISGKFINEMGGVPYPKDWKIYGNLEHSLWVNAQQRGYKWGMLADYIVKHPNTDGTLLREWKNSLVFGQFKEKNQIPFVDWLQLKIDGKI